MRGVSEELKDLGGALFGHSEPPKKRAKLSHRTKQKPKAAAWYDPQDDELTIDIERNRKLRSLRTDFEENEIVASEYIDRQRKRFQGSAQIDWTKPPDDDSSDTGDSIDHSKSAKSEALKSSKRSLKITAMAPDLIPNDQLAFTDLGLINGGTVHKSVVTVCEYHPNGSVLMTGGLDKTLSLYSMDFHHNELLKQLFVQDLPIRCARFSHDGKEIMIGGRRFFLYCFNLDNFQLRRIDKLVGRDERSWEYFEYSPNGLHIVFAAPRGMLVVVSVRTKKPIKTLQITGQVSMIRFNSIGDRMLVLTTNGTVFVYDMRSFRCVDRVMFEGIVKATCFDVMESLNLIAVGCNSGVVGVYRFRMRSSDPRNGINLLLDDKGGDDEDEDGEEEDEDGDGLREPIFSVSNLTTATTGVQFNHDGQLMAVWSRNEKQQLRMVHVQSGRVFKNWPKKGTLGFVYRVKFSPHSGFFTVANGKGQVRLIRLPFYGNV